ncbi:MAG TPA: sulfurtransferase [Actinomycetota bacterium]|jgi:thiosulfate/3-mercaptopyruvate sulfurtransferase|nr:sulfurtransferase [Actinomycetota bacterium]
MSEYANPGALVETDWLAEHLDDPAIRVVEVDEDLTAYQKGHIPGAVQWSWFGDLHDPVRRDFIDQARLSELLSRSGVSRDTTVILYGGNNNWFAAYAHWLLKHLGFERVKLLNGGRQKWELESRELTTERPSPQTTSFRVVAPVRKELRALRDEVLTSLGQAAFVDVRAPEEYRGEKLAPDHLPQEQAQVPGHIPGAVNITWSKAANEDGTFRSADELRELYGEIDRDSKVISYCRIGERSSHTWFVLSELLGYPNAKNYDGSWTEYGSLVGAPVER